MSYRFHHVHFNWAMWHRSCIVVFLMTRPVFSMTTPIIHQCFQCVLEWGSLLWANTLVISCYYDEWMITLLRWMICLRIFFVFCSWFNFSPKYQYFENPSFSLLLSVLKKPICWANGNYSHPVLLHPCSLRFNWTFYYFLHVSERQFLCCFIVYSRTLQQALTALFRATCCHVRNHGKTFIPIGRYFTLEDPWGALEGEGTVLVELLSSYKTWD